MAKGQIISADFIVSIAVFILMISIIMTLYSKVYEDKNQRQFIEDMQVRSFFVTDALLKTTGTPSNWNSTSATSIGLSENGKISIKKMRNLVGMDTDKIKDLLVIEGMNFNFSFYDTQNYYLMTGAAASPAAYFYTTNSKMMDLIDGSGLVWDLYYGNAGPPIKNYRNVYSGLPVATFNMMLDNSTYYRTIIIEDPELQQTDIEIQKLKDFVTSGGILIVEGDATLITDGFSMHESSTGAGPIESLLKDASIIEAPYDSNVTFASADSYFYQGDGDAALSIIAEDKSIPGRALIGKWQYGAGLIYYITNIDATVETGPLSQIFYIIGKRAEITSGPMNSTIPNTRAIATDAEVNSMGKAVLVIGR